MTGMNTVPIMKVLSTPCCSHGTNYRIILKIYLSTFKGCVKKNFLYVLSYKKYLKRALKNLISLKNYNDFEFIVTLYTYTINGIRYLTFGCPSAKPEGC